MGTEGGGRGGAPAQGHQETRTSNARLDRQMHAANTCGYMTRDDGKECVLGVL